MSIRETCPHFQCETRQSLVFKWALALNPVVLNFVFELNRIFLEKRMGFLCRSTAAKIPECPVIHHPKIGLVRGIHLSPSDVKKQIDKNEKVAIIRSGT